MLNVNPRNIGLPVLAQRRAQQIFLADEYQLGVRLAMQKRKGGWDSN